MQTSFLSLILTGLFPMMVIGGDFWLEKQSKEKTLEGNLAITQAETTNQIRDEKDLQQRAIAQGYQLRDAELDPQDSDRETYSYTVFAQNPANSQWYNLCASDKGQATKAMLLSGSWDETGAHIGDRNITVACTSGVLAKCVRWGYKPWKTFQGVYLRDYHQACTRMARADYCGNGNSHTQDGTVIEDKKILITQKYTI